MKTARLPDDEKARLEALRQAEVLDTAPEQVFDQLTDLAARLCEAPVALISLVDVDRQWFKSKHGLEVSETPRDVAFCAHTILQRDVFVVADALEDERFADNPLVAQDPKIRFYAGSPLLTADGHAIGTFCVIDYVPRELAPEKAEVLRVLARHTAAMLQLRRSKALLEEHSRSWERAAETGDTAAKEEALEALGACFNEMTAERERAEAALCALRQEYEALAGEEHLDSTQGLAHALDKPLHDVLDSSDALLSRIDKRNPLRRHADVIHDAAERACSILTAAEKATGKNGGDGSG